MCAIHIKIKNRQKTLPLDRRRMTGAIRRILREANVVEAEISVAVVDDALMAELHGRYLDDPTPTDVLSFPLEQSPGRLEGEIIVSADTAVVNAAKYHAVPAEELLLYVIHGTLHLVGYDDTTPPQRATMRKQEKKHLAACRDSDAEKPKKK
jgi:probable rRNA maturation factor